MSTATNLFVILVFLAAFYSILGLLCGLAEKAGELRFGPHRRRRARTRPRRRREGRRS